MMYTEFVKDFAQRTKQNYNSLAKGQYEVTQLINSAVGLLIIPNQKMFNKIEDSIISEELFDRVKGCIIQNTYAEAMNLKQFTRHLRNSIAHGNMEFVAEQNSITGKTIAIHSVIFTDTDKQHNRKNFHEITIKMPIGLLREFFFAFADAISNIK